MGCCLHLFLTRLYTTGLGGDSYTSFSWWAKPGHKPIYDDYTHGMPDDFFFEIQSLDLCTESYKFAVEDNLKQFDMGEESDDDKLAQNDTEE